MTSSPTSKRARTTASSSSPPSPPYELIYWPTIPGRGEPIRLCFEATSTPYIDVTNTQKDGMSTLKSLLSSSDPPHFAPPMLKHGDLVISQLPNILLYLGPKLGLLPEDNGGDENAIYHVNQLALTALDGFLNEAHDTHHPIAVLAYYEDQKSAAKERSKNYIADRLPKFLSYFESVLNSASSKGGEYLYGGKLTYADLVLFQCLDGVSFAFPKAVERLRGSGEYEGVWKLYERVKGMEEVRAYLGSERRMKYGNGIWRHYPELDEE
ncbi:MAG: hypothetical protein LQ338_004716 [Usnochroma carphineum]|nr:MAG: hypothetical protein LQ338_004716 [Usnochroma carphineum]